MMSNTEYCFRLEMDNYVIEQVVKVSGILKDSYLYELVRGIIWLKFHNEKIENDGITNI